MKVLVNGGLNLSVLDGWWEEGYDPKPAGRSGMAMRSPKPGGTRRRYTTSSKIRWCRISTHATLQAYRVTN